MSPTTWQERQFVKVAVGSTWSPRAGCAGVLTFGARGVVITDRDGLRVTYRPANGRGALTQARDASIGFFLEHYKPGKTVRR